MKLIKIMHEVLNIHLAQTLKNSQKFFEKKSSKGELKS